MQTERQTQILEAALELISEKGIQGCTIKNLSKKIGISEPAIYRHFASKTEILLTILNNFKEIAHRMRQVIQDSDGTAFEKIEFMFMRISEMFQDTPSLISIVFSEEIFKNEEVLKQKIIEVLDANKYTIENILKEGQKNGDVRTDISNEHLALIVMGSLRFLVKQWDLKGKSKNIEAEVKELLHSIKLIISK